MGIPLRVLIVEDSVDDAELVLRQLRRAGYDPVSERVQTADEMKTALEREAWDLVVCDYTMPQFDAPTALNLLNQSGRDVPFIVVSGSIGEDIAVTMMKSGAHDYILKGNLTRLVPALQRELRDAKNRQQQRLTEQARQRAEAELRLQSAALTAAADSIVITDRNGTIQWVNPAFTALTYYRAEDAIGKNPRELSKSGLHDQRFYRDMWNTILAGHVWHGEMTNRRKDGSLYSEEQSITSVKDARGELTHFVAIGRDLTEQKRLEAQLLHAQKMEVVGRLASGIAHDFNNLLTVINGTAELILMDLKEGEPVRADVQAIGKAGMRAASLTRQLLAFSRKQIMKPVALNLNSLLADLKDMLQRLIGENITLMIVPAKDGGRIMADPGQIEQVVMNLAVNARDAMANGGRLTIETRDVELDEASAAEHPSLQPGPHVSLAISDTGGGMDEATRVQIFDPFFTTKESGKGTGLGLSTVYGIIKQSGGSIGVSSELGMGSTFTIYLPLVADVTQKSPPAPTVTSVRDAETVLIVDDEEAICRLTKRVLQSAGYTVLTASSGGEALLLLERHDGPVHLMLTDMVMPRVSGRELAAQLTDLRPRMKVLYMSGYTDDTILRRGLLDRAAHFIAKPYTTAELTRTVREVLDS
jgi:two-component system, cell cycle sensor histidine kinase and response regulator CckA